MVEEQQQGQRDTNEKNDINIEMKKYSLELVNQWINNADTKVSIAFGIISVIFAGFGTFFALTLKDYKWNEISGQMLTLIIFGSFGILAFILSLIFYGIALFPSFVGKKDNESEYNLLFYADISRYKKNNFKKYKENFKDYDRKKFLNDIEEEIFYNSIVCYRKMNYFRMGLLSTGIFSIFISFFSFVSR